MTAGWLVEEASAESGGEKLAEARGARASVMFSLHRPYFDLGAPARDAPLNSQGPLLAYDLLDSEERLGLQRSLTENFRFNLIDESGLSEYAVLAPAEVPEALRTSRWRRLCELVDSFDTLTAVRQVRVAHLLLALDFYREMLRVIPPRALRVDDRLEVAYLRACAEYHLLQQNADYEPLEFRRILAVSPLASEVARNTAMTVMIFMAKIRRDLAAAEELRERVEMCLRASVYQDGSFRFNIVRSQFYRGASYVPFLRRDHEVTVREMNLAEAHAREAVRLATTPAESLVASDNLYFAVESQMRTAEWIGDHDLALTRVREMMALDPWDSKTRIEHGEMLVRRGQIEEAAGQYAMAADLAPPGTVIALHSAAACFQRLGQLDRARELYMRALDVDPLGISTTQGLRDVCAELGELPLSGWAEKRLRWLGSGAGEHG